MVQGYNINLPEEERPLSPGYPWGCMDEINCYNIYTLPCGEFPATIQAVHAEVASAKSWHLDQDLKWSKWYNIFCKALCLDVQNLTHYQWY